MPIKMPDGLPAIGTLNNENIFFISDNRAEHQDIRPLKIVILNLMPNKIATEIQILRLIGNSPLQVDISLLHPETHISKNTSNEHLIKFYYTFEEIKNEKFDGMIITGAPIEQMEFEEVDYWEELKKIMEWSKYNVYSTLHICWGAQAGLYYHYGIPKYQLKSKMFGVFLHKILKKNIKLLMGFDDEFYVPHSRYTEVKREDIEKLSALNILCESDISGIYMVTAFEGRQIFVTGHCEYDSFTLKSEYDRDVARGIDIAIPANYYQGDDPSRPTIVRWRCHANLLFENWLNYYVYQETPFNLGDLH